jgi:putative inorganic carbon (hco3(-)) transporter
MESGDAAQLAAVAGGLGAACALLAAERLLLLAGLALLAAGEAGLVLSTSGDNGVSTSLVALGAAGLVPLAAGAALFVRWPIAVLPTVLAAAPFRPPLEFDSGNRFFVAVAEEGELGRLLPLYGVLGAAALALAWAVLRGSEVRRLPLVVALPAAAFFALAALSLTWSKDVDAGANTLAFFLLPFATLLAVAGRASFPPGLTRVLAAIAVALACVFAAVGLWQAATHELLFFSPSVEVGNVFSSFFRVTSLFRDPSLYGRHLVIGIAVLLVLLLRGRLHPLLALALIAFLWAGLFFSYSQSSFVALFVVVLAAAVAAGDRRLRAVAVVAAAIVALTGAGLVAAEADDQSARRVTSDRSRRIDLTLEVVRDNPVKGVGLGAQPVASQARSDQGGSPSRFVSHTTPLTVAAELGLLGLVAYLALLAGAAILVDRVRRIHFELGLTLAAVLLALVVHSLAYSGFFEDPVTWVAIAVGSAFLLRREAGTGDTAILEPS